MRLNKVIVEDRDEIARLDSNGCVGREMAR